MERYLIYHNAHPTDADPKGPEDFRRTHNLARGLVPPGHHYLGVKNSGYLLEIGRLAVLSVPAEGVGVTMTPATPASRAVYAEEAADVAVRALQRVADGARSFGREP